MDGVMGVVTCFGADFPPKSWALCNGQLMSVNQNQALFSILGTSFGGDGVNTFALPNLQGQTAVSSGAPPQGGSYTFGTHMGNELVKLTPDNLPPHTHNGNISLSVDADSEDASVARAANTVPAKAAGAYSTDTSGSMAAVKLAPTVLNAGAGAGFSMRNPYLVLNHIICLYGTYPSRS